MSSEPFGNKLKKSHVTAQSTVCPAKNILGVCNKENSKSTSLPGCRIAKHSSAENKSSDGAVSRTVVKTLRRNHGSRSTSSCPASSRSSIGPLVKTKTGLIPAVTQASQIRGHTSVREIGATKSAVNKVTPRNWTGVTASKSSGGLADKKMPAPVFKSSVQEKAVSSMVEVKIKVQGHNRASSNLQLDKNTRPSKSQQSNKPKSLSNLYKCANTANNHKEKPSKCHKPTTQPTNWSTNPKPQPQVGKSGQLHTVPSQTSRTGGAHRTKDEQAQKNKTSSRNDDTVGRGSAHVQQKRRTVAAKPTQAASVPKQATGTKVKVPGTLVPQTERKQQTAAQAERM